MKTVTKFTAILVTLLIVNRLSSQGMYVDVGLGYGFSTASANNVSNYTSTSSGSTSTYDYSAVKGSGSFGKGLQIGGIFGYMFNQNVGAELGISYLMGGTIKYTNTNTNSFGSNTSDYTMKSHMLRFVPSMRLTAGDGKIKPYMRTGIVIGVGTKITETEESTSTSGTSSNKTEREGVYSGGISLGFAGALGATYALSEKLSIFAELAIITQSWAPKKNVATKYSVDGVDKLANQTTSQKETDYLKSYTETSPSNDPGSPSKNLRIYAPFSSAGINVGVHITFGSK